MNARALRKLRERLISAALARPAAGRPPAADYRVRARAQPETAQNRAAEAEAPAAKGLEQSDRRGSSAEAQAHPTVAKGRRVAAVLYSDYGLCEASFVEN